MNEISTLSAVRRYCSRCKDGTWCDHLTRYIQYGYDAPEYDFGVRFEVPIMASLSFFVTVHITEDSIAGVCAPINLVVEDLFTSSETEYPLGLWNKGEGMWSIRSVVLDWIKHRCQINKFGDVAQCPSSSHTLKHARQLNKIEQSSIMLHNWTIAAYGLCYPQFMELANVSGLVPMASDPNKTTNPTLQNLKDKQNGP